MNAELGTLFNQGVTAGLTDGQLLERFSMRRGEAAELAFAALVERHGRFVLNTCQKILRDNHEAEDALQATFLVLAYKSDALWVEDSLAPWLHRVACRIAIRAKLTASRRKLAEQAAAQEASDRSASQGRDDLGAALHEAIDRLPGHYRRPVVLCDLEGRTYEEAARHLGCPVGTVKSRLARGRQMLRERLVRPGFALPAGFPAREMAQVPMPARLSDSMVQAATRITAGKTAAGVVSASVVALTEGMLKMMFIARLTRGVGAAVAVSVAVLTIGMGVIAYRTTGAPPEAGGPDRAVSAASPSGNDRGPTQKGKPRRGEIIAQVADENNQISMVALDPVTAKWRAIAKNLPPGPISPDGRFIVYSQLGRDHDEAELGIWIYDTTGKLPPRRIFEQNGQPHWSDNGQRVVIGVPIGQGGQKFETWRVNVDGSGRTRLPVPETDLVLDCSRDGSWLAMRPKGGEPAHRGALRLVHPDGTGARILAEGSAQDDLYTIPRISPDGRSVAWVEVRTEGSKDEGYNFYQIAPDGRSINFTKVKTGNQPRTCRLLVLDLEGGPRRVLPVTFEPGVMVSATWSPDGSGLALNLHDRKTKRGSIAQVDRDGKNFRTLPLPPGHWNVVVCGWQTLAPELRVSDLDELTAPDANSPRGRYRALLEKVETATPRNPQFHVGRFLELAEAVPEDRVAVDAWIWIVTNGFDGPAFWRAVDRLAEPEHVKTIKVGHAALSVSHSVSPAAEKLLRAVLEKNDDHAVRGLACLALGQYLKNQAERLQGMADPEKAKEWERLFLENGSTKENIARFLANNPDNLMKEAEVVFERTAREFGEVPHARNENLGQAAGAELNEIRNLCVGKPAPEIEGEDADGTRIRLSDFRGKVTVISFWADWCRSCSVMYKDENAIRARMQGRPFTLLGVNSDDDRGKLKELIKQEGLTWRSWWDGGGNANTPGPIARRYNVHHWPTLYVLDHHGIIRHKYLGIPDPLKLNAAIDALVKAAEGQADVP
nr:sigma-70 family RNA polymerase sigma factor [Singulisphaera sp. GP187]